MDTFINDDDVLTMPEAIVTSVLIVAVAMVIIVFLWLVFNAD